VVVALLSAGLSAVFGAVSSISASFLFLVCDRSPLRRGGAP